VAVARVLSGTHATLSEHVVAACLDELVVGIPKALAQLVMATVWALLELPVEGAPAAPESALLPAPEVLPAWLPTRRTLGGFYVVRAIGGGGVSSVFLVNRVEERNDAGAEKFALKVPEYSATAARSVSEDEFLKMFRAEASALLLLPTHPNLARFVTFDVGARPKPILVMEFVEGVTLERTIESGTLDIATALRVLREVLLGLEAMHAVEVGHLDLKPSNVMLRKSTEAVLVDFGLTGRHIRPGCATGPYGAPEVWGVIPDGCTPTPMKADVYAFGCLAFEVLTGKALFSADNEMMQVALHVGHDGDPLPVRRLGAQPGYEKLASLLKGTLRRDPRQRFSAAQVRVALDNMAAELVKRPWPVAS
jgi:serine/threonine protein kinase